MAAVAPTRRRWTLANLPELPDDGRTYDILGGELVVRNVPNVNHSLALTELFLLLGRAQEAGFGAVLTTVTAVALDYPERGEAAEDVSHPDLVFVRQERLELLGWQAIEGPPDLVIEILSPGTLHEHRPGGKWWEAYARHGVPCYWLVDLARRRILQYTLQGEIYRPGRYGEPVTLQAEDTLSSPLFPGVEVPVARVFQRLRSGPGRKA